MLEINTRTQTKVWDVEIMYYEIKSQKSEDKPRVRIGLISEYTQNDRTKMMLNFRCKPRGSDETIEFAGVFDKEDLFRNFAKDIAHKELRGHVKQALCDSEEYFKKNFPDMKPDNITINFGDRERGIRALAIANEICTLNWVLGEGKLNCYENQD